MGEVRPWNECVASADECGVINLKHKKVEKIRIWNRKNADKVTRELK